MDRREIWSAGLSLSHSLSRLCPEADVAVFRRKDANRKPFRDSIGALFALFKRDMTDEARTAAMAAQAEYSDSDSNRAADEALLKLRRFLVHQLRVGNFLALAIQSRAARTMRRSQLLIPEEAAHRFRDDDAPYSD